MKLYVLSKLTKEKIYFCPKYVNLEVIRTRKILKEIIGGDYFEFDNREEQFSIADVRAERDLKYPFVIGALVAFFSAIMVGYCGGVKAAVISFVLFFIFFGGIAEFQGKNDFDRVSIFNNS